MGKLLSSQIGVATCALECSVRRGPQASLVEGGWHSRLPLTCAGAGSVATMHGALPGKGLGCWACRDTARRTAARAVAPIVTRRRSCPPRLIPFVRAPAQSWWNFTAPHTSSSADSDQKTLLPSETHTICPSPRAIMVEFHGTSCVVQFGCQSNSPRVLGQWCHLRDGGAPRHSHSRESGNPLRKPWEMRCSRTGFPLSRE